MKQRIFLPKLTKAGKNTCDIVASKLLPHVQLVSSCSRPFERSFERSPRTPAQAAPQQHRSRATPNATAAARLEKPIHSNGMKLPTSFWVPDGPWNGRHLRLLLVSVAPRRCQTSAGRLRFLVLLRLLDSVHHNLLARTRRPASRRRRRRPRPASRLGLLVLGTPCTAARGAVSTATDFRTIRERSRGGRRHTIRSWGRAANLDGSRFMRFRAQGGGGYRVREGGDTVRIIEDDVKHKFAARASEVFVDRFCVSFLGE